MTGEFLHPEIRKEKIADEERSETSPGRDALFLTKAKAFTFEADVQKVASTCRINLNLLFGATLKLTW